MAASKVEDLINLNNKSVLKFHIGGILIADGGATVPDIETLVDAQGMVTVPTGYESCGWVTTDGVTKSRAMTSDDTMGWQSLAAIRTDLTADNMSFKAKLQEYNKVTFALRQGLSLADAATKFVAGGVASARNTSGSQPARRGIIIARDTNYDITLALVCPNFVFSDQGDEALGRSTELQLDATFKANYDHDAGTDVLEALNGPGLAALINAPTGG